MKYNEQKNDKSLEDVLDFIHRAAGQYNWAVVPDEHFLHDLAQGLLQNYQRFEFFNAPVVTAMVIVSMTGTLCAPAFIVLTTLQNMGSATAAYSSRINSPLRENFPKQFQSGDRMKIFLIRNSPASSSAHRNCCIESISCCHQVPSSTDSLIRI